MNPTGRERPAIALDTTEQNAQWLRALEADRHQPPPRIPARSLFSRKHLPPQPLDATPTPSPSLPSSPHAK